MKGAYADAIAEGYRFYSYGDCCLIERGQATSWQQRRMTEFAFEGLAAPRPAPCSPPWDHRHARFMPVGSAAMLPQFQSAHHRHAVSSPTATISCCAPGTVARLGGLHRFMGCDPHRIRAAIRPCRSRRYAPSMRRASPSSPHLDGSRHLLTPERAVEIRRLLGSTIAPWRSTNARPGRHRRVGGRSLHAALRALGREAPCRHAFEPRPGFALFSIVQGGIYYRGLRRKSAEALARSASRAMLSAVSA